MNKANKPIFDTAKWKSETYRQLLYPGGSIPKFDRKPPTFFYGSIDDEVETDQEIDLDAVGFEA